MNKWKKLMFSPIVLIGLGVVEYLRKKNKHKDANNVEDLIIKAYQEL